MKIKNLAATLLATFIAATALPLLPIIILIESTIISLAIIITAITGLTNPSQAKITKTVLENTAIEIVLEEKGTYGIKMSQTNMFGTISDESAGVYSYKYE